MFRILKFLITGRWKVCDHHWEEVNRIEYFAADSVVNPKAIIVEMRCKHCGKERIYKIK